MNKRSEAIPKGSTKRPQASEVLGIFEQMLPCQVILELMAETKLVYYTRLLPPILVLWGFIYQRLNSDHSCDAAWSYLSSATTQEQFGLKKKRPSRRSESSSAYVQARQRLPLSVACGALQATAAYLAEQAGETGRWHGQRVNLFDGSTLLLQATPEIREQYGTYHNQHGDYHWPMMRLMAGFDYWSGAATGVCEGPYSVSEHPLAAQLIGQLGAGWVHVGDRYLGVYHILQAVSAARSQAVLRLNWRAAKPLAGDQALTPKADLDVVWERSPHDQVEPDLPTPPIAGRLIYVRLEKDGFRPIDLYLFTTLTDRHTYPQDELVALYSHRWNIELDLRHVKDTLEMDHLDGKSVELVRKELILGLLAYNLIRGLMAQAALQTGQLPCQLSLAQSWRRTLDACRGLPPHASAEQVDEVLSYLLDRLGRCVLLKRKRERFEPRAVWGRPRPYPRIKGSREDTRAAQMKLLKSKS